MARLSNHWTERVQEVLNSMTPELRKEALPAFRDEFPEYYWTTDHAGRVKITSYPR